MGSAPKVIIGPPPATLPAPPRIPGRRTVQVNSDGTWTESVIEQPPAQERASERRYGGPDPFRWRYSPPSGTSQGSGSADASSDVTIDASSGMDEAVKRGDELSQAVAAHRGLLYGSGGDLDIGAILSAAERIRALKGYLSGFGAASESSPYPIRTPLVRIAGGRSSARSGANANSSATTGGWDAYQ